MDIAAVVGDLDARLRAAANPDRAPAERAYLKSDLTHLGAGVPATRRAVKVILAEHGPVDRDDLVAIIEALWAATVYEHRRVRRGECHRVRAARHLRQGPRRGMPSPVGSVRSSSREHVVQ